VERVIRRKVTVDGRKKRPKRIGDMPPHDDAGKKESNQRDYLGCTKKNSLKRVGE